MSRFNPGTPALDSVVVLLNVPLGGSAVVTYTYTLTLSYLQEVSGR